MHQTSSISLVFLRWRQWRFYLQLPCVGKPLMFMLDHLMTSAWFPIIKGVSLSAGSCNCFIVHLDTSLPTRHCLLWIWIISLSRLNAVTPNYILFPPVLNPFVWSFLRRRRHCVRSVQRGTRRPHQIAYNLLATRSPTWQLRVPDPFPLVEAFIYLVKVFIGEWNAWSSKALGVTTVTSAFSIECWGWDILVWIYYKARTWEKEIRLSDIQSTYCFVSGFQIGWVTLPRALTPKTKASCLTSSGTSLSAFVLDEWLVLKVSSSPQAPVDRTVFHLAGYRI